MPFPYAMEQCVKAFMETRFTHETIAHQLIYLYARLLTWNESASCHTRTLT